MAIARFLVRFRANDEGFRARVRSLTSSWRTGFSGHRPAHGLVEPCTARLAHDCTRGNRCRHRICARGFETSSFRQENQSGGSRDRIARVGSETTSRGGAGGREHGPRAALRESHTNRVKAVQEEQGTENAILALAAQDKESAVVRLTIEIEKELAAVFHASGLGTEPPKTIRELVNKLVEKKVLSPSTGTAILEFRDVRNQVIHPRQAGTVPASALASAIDSGIRILHILRSMSD